MKKRVLSMFMALALCLTLLPAPAFAEGADGSAAVGATTEGSGQSANTGESEQPNSETDTRTEIWCVGKPDSIGRSYDGTTDGSTIPINLTFTDGTNKITLEERTDFTAKKTFDSADAGDHTVTVEITLIGNAATKYKLKSGEEKFEIRGAINKAYPKLTVSLSQTTCTVGEKILPLLSVSGVQENAAVTYYYTPYESIAGYSEYESSGDIPAIDENTAINSLDEEGNNTYYVYAKTAATTNYTADMSNIVELTVTEPAAASVSKADGTDGGTYKTLPAALNAAQNGDTVTLLSDVDLGETYVTIDKSITFDLGDKTLSSSKAWLSYGVLMVKNATVTVKNGTVKAAEMGSCAIRAYGSGASMTLENVTATVTSGKSSVTVGDFGSAVIKSGDYQGLYVGAKSQVTLEGGTFHPYMDTITNENVKSIFWKVNETTDATSRDCMELLGDGCVYVDENRTQVRTSGGFNAVVTVQQGTAIDAPVAKIGDVKYASLSKAIDAVQNGGTITLLNDLDLGNGAVLRVGSSKKDFTIDLDSHTLSADGACLIMLHNGSQLTLKNGTLDGSRCTSYEGVLYISSNSGPKLTLENVTAKSGSVADSLNNQRSVLLAYVTYGTVEFDGGTYTGGVLLKTDGNAVLKSGTFQKGTNNYSIKTEDSGKHLSDYLDDDSQFWDDNTPLDLSNKTQTADEVTVRPCEHKWENGKCTVCQKVCDHGSADGKSMTEDPCPTCGMKAAAQVDITGSDAKYFPSFTDALVYATKNNGCTLKLLADVPLPEGTTLAIVKPLILDLNGHSIDRLSASATVKIRDSGTTRGKIGALTVSNMMDADGHVTDLTLGDLLEEGYAFKYENGHWADDSHKETISGLDVTVEKAPIQSVEVYAKDKKNKEVPTNMAYGTTGEVTLVSSCRMGETSGADLTYLWYKLDGAAATAPLEGATGANYTLPDNLAAGTHTYLLICTSDGYSKSKEITITVTPISLEGAEVTVENPTYNGQKQFPAVTVKLDENTTLTKGTDFYVDATMQANAGSYTLTVNGNGNYSGKIENVEWKIEPMKIDSVMVSSDISKVYDGTAEINMSANEWATALKFKTLSASGVVDVPSKTYTISDAYFVKKSGEETIYSPDAGEKYGITFKITLNDDNYVLQTYGEDTPSTSKVITQSGGATFTIKQATVTSPGEITQLVFNDLAKTYTIDLSKLLPKLDSPMEYGKVTYALDTVSINGGYYDATQGDAEVKDGKLILPIQAVETSKESNIGTVTVKVTSGNIVDFTLTVNVSAKNRITPTGTPTLSKNAIIYGDALNTIALSGKLHDNVNNKNVEGMFMWADGTVKPSAGSYEAAWKFTPTDGDTYTEADGTVTITVNKAKPTGDPIYTRITAANKTLKDANLKSNTSWPTGTIQWVDKDGKELPDTTEVKANTAYKWIFTPGAEFAANYTTATGELTLYSVSTGGGGGGGSSSGSTVKTDTVTNPDGSVTKTETKSDGTVVETTTGKDGIVSKTTTNPNGSSVTETKAADGSTGTVKTDKNGQTEAKTALSSKAIEDAKRNGEPVKAPVEVKASRNSNTAPTVKVELPKGTGETKVEIPVSNVKPGTVAVLVHPDGTEEIVKNSLPTEDGIQLTVNGGATVKIVDNSKDFIDTRSHWAKDAIGFVSARGLVNGMSATIYAPNASTTRAQLWTILARQNNADLTGGATWFENAQNWAREKGISDGTNPNGTINRAQMVTMLWRAMGQPAAASGASFADVPADSYYAQAVAWAIENGITAGVGGGRFDPNSTCTRAQIATFLYRLYLSR